LRFPVSRWLVPSSTSSMGSRLVEKGTNSSILPTDNSILVTSIHFTNFSITIDSTIKMDSSSNMLKPEIGGSYNSTSVGNNTLTISTGHSTSTSYSTSPVGTSKAEGSSKNQSTSKALTSNSSNVRNVQARTETDN